MAAFSTAKIMLSFQSHKDLEQTRRKLYQILDEAFYLTSDSGKDTAEKRIEDLVFKFGSLIGLFSCLERFRNMTGTLTLNY